MKVSGEAHLERRLRSSPAVLIEGPRHLFPFARSVVANVTRDGGFPPMMIDPIDFAALYMENDAARAGFDIS